jgi:hypothetical protein
MDANQFFIDQQVRQAESSAWSAANQIRSAPTIRAVLGLCDVPLHPMIRFMKHQIPGLRRLKEAAERRAEELVQAQLAELKTLSAEEKEQRLGQLRARDWMLLRGNFPRLAGLVDRESQKLRRELKTMEASRSPAPGGIEGG